MPGFSALRIGLQASVLAVLACIVMATSGEAGRTCSSVVVRPCTRRETRDVVFLVDASDSMSPSNFYGQMLDFVQSAYCAFDSSNSNRVAMITFAKTIDVRVPLARYTWDEWFNKVDEVRADPNACCSCCTPSAEAFREARNMLTNNPPLTDDTVRIVLMISDGQPWQNTNGDFSTKRFGPAKYTYDIVPRQARLLRNLDGRIDAVRLLFLGVPDKWAKSADFSYFKGDQLLGKKKCIKRARKTQCVKIPKKTTLFPISSSPTDRYVMVSGTWDVEELIEIVDDNLCRPFTDAPSKSPTQLPTFAPTRATSAPTSSPTERRRFDSLDLYLFLDRSRSMRWRHEVCRSAPGGSQDWSTDTACWQLFLGFAESLGVKASQLRDRTEGPSQRQAIGWRDDYTDPTKGLRVWVYGFACADAQSRPIVEIIGEKITNFQDFEAAIDRARTIVPIGGTCPGAMMERALGMIMANELLERPFKAAVLASDGVWYDSPRPETAAKGFPALGVLTYALGISIPESGDNKGLTPAEIRDQKKQLTGFVNNDESRFINFDIQGYNALDSIAESFIGRLPDDVEQNFARVSEKPWFCGFSNRARCLNTTPETFDTSRYCKWIPANPDKPNGKGNCMDRDWCGWTASKCKADKDCKWSNGKCEFKGWTKLSII